MEVNFLKSESMYAIITWRFPIWYFFLVLLWVNRCVFSPSVLLRVLLSLSIRLFCYVLFVPIFCSKIVLFPCHPVVGAFNLFLLIEFYYCYYYYLWVFHTSVIFFCTSLLHSLIMWLIVLSLCQIIYSCYSVVSYLILL